MLFIMLKGIKKQSSSKKEHLTVNKQTLSVLIDDLKIITIIVNLYKNFKKNLKFEIQITKARSKLFN